MSVLLRRAALPVLALFAFLLLFAAACADSAEAPKDSPTIGASVTPGVPTDSATPTPVPTPRPSAPADWPTFTDADGRFSLRYPPDWYSDERGSFYSYDTVADPGPAGHIRAGEVKAEVNIYRTPRPVCGPLEISASGEVAAIGVKVTETTLGGQPAWEIVRDNPDPPSTLIRGFIIVHDGYCVNLIAYYTQETPDEKAFAQIADSFEIYTLRSGPADWPTYTDPGGAFSLRYPPDWYPGDGKIYSYDPGGATGSPGSWPTGVEVEVGRFAGPASVCGPLTVDSVGEIGSIEPGAAVTTLGGQPAWEVIQDDPDPPATRIHGISLLHEGYCILLTAYFMQEEPDEETFAQIADSFEFHF